MGSGALVVLVPIMRDQVGPVLDQVARLDRASSSSRTSASACLPRAWSLAIMIFPDHLLHQPRCHARGADSSARGSAGAGRHAVGDAAHRRSAQRAASESSAPSSLGLAAPWARRSPSRWSSATIRTSSRTCSRPAYTLASVIANEFTEATGDLYVSALIEIGLALFLVTIVVNAIARILVWAVTRDNQRGRHDAAALPERSRQMERIVRTAALPYQPRRHRAVASSARSLCWFRWSRSSATCSTRERVRSISRSSRMFPRRWASQAAAWRTPSWARA